MYSVNLRMLPSTPHHNQQGRVQEVTAQKCRRRCWKKYPSQWCDLNSLHRNSPSYQSQNSQVTSCPLSKALQFAKIFQLHDCHCFIQVYSTPMLDEIASCHLRSFRIRQKIKPTNLVSFVFAYGLLFIVLYLLLTA